MIWLILTLLVAAVVGGILIARNNAAKVEKTVAELAIVREQVKAQVAKLK